MSLANSNDLRNEYDVYLVTQRDPFNLVLMGGYLAHNGHDAIQQCIKWENEEVSPLAANDFVAYPKWAAQREHYPGYSEANA